MNLYNSISTACNIPVDDVEYLSTDDIIGNAREAEQFRSRLDCPQILTGICQDYELGFVDAKATIRRLEIGGLLETPDALCRLICAGVRALAEGART